FTILVTDIRYQDDAAAVAERILLQLRSPLSVDDTELVVSASIGIALSGAEWLGPDDLLRSADEAMYQAKALGGGRYVMADGESQSQRFGRFRRPRPGR
ncbi:MAG TPA: diguanylate cyclase, partial [Pirellulales bacterium]|nr:diguanylate cyclase [Pirellulales bacterium]